MLITSFANPAVKRYKALAARKARRRERAFTVEGLQPVWRAVEASQQPRSPWQIDTLIVSPDLLRHEPSWQMVDESERRGVTVTQVSREVFEHLSDRDGPAGLAAVVTGEIPGVDSFQPIDGRPVLALHRIGNPGNIGTILRSADAAGAGGVVLVGPCADPLAPTATKSSMGSVFAVPLAEVGREDDFFAWSTGRPVIAVTGHTETSLWHTPIEPGSVLLFGSEGDGLPDEMARRCEAQVMIPMTGTAESLNLATAASVVLFDLARRRDLSIQL